MNEKGRFIFRDEAAVIFGSDAGMEIDVGNMVVFES